MTTSRGTLVEYDEEVFCRACLEHLPQQSRRLLQRADIDDAIMEFVALMLRTGRWRDYDHRRPVAAFVVRWFRNFVRFGFGYKVTGQSRGRTERRLRRHFCCDSANGCAVSTIADMGGVGGQRVLLRQRRCLIAERFADMARLYSRVVLVSCSKPQAWADASVLQTVAHIASIGNDPFLGAAAVHGMSARSVRLSIGRVRAAVREFVLV